MADLKKLEKDTKKFAEFLSDPEARLLHDFAKNCTGKGIIVEIGSWKGRSTIWLAKGSKSGNKVQVVAIDPHTGSPEHGKVNTFKEFKSNISSARVNDVVTPVVKTSEDAIKGFKGKVELLFIDGNHDYEFVKKDFELWSPKLIEGGIIAFHDSHLWNGPKRVVRESIFGSRQFRNIGFVDSITFAEKVSENSFGERLENRRVQVLEELYTLGRKASLSLPIPQFLKTGIKGIFGKAQ